MRISDWSSDVCSSDLFHIFCAPAQAFTFRFITGGVQSPGTEPVRPEAKAYIAIDPCEEIHGPGAVGEYVLFGQIGYGGLIQEISFFTPGQQAKQEAAGKIGRASCRESMGQNV